MPDAPRDGIEAEMVYHRAQAQFDRARWNLRVLVPAWVVQLAVLLTLVGLFSYRLADTMSHYKELEEQGLVPVVEIVSVSDSKSRVHHR